MLSPELGGGHEAARVHHASRRRGSGLAGPCADRQTITIDYLSADGRGERFPALAAECVRLQADIIVVSTTPAAQAAKNATRTIPIVMIALGDPVGTGLVDSLARPGANVTGMSLMVPELAAKRLGLLKGAVPGLSRVLVLSYLADPIAPLQVTALKEAAPPLGVTPNPGHPDWR